MTEEKKKYGWGGKRPNQTGRPKGTTKPEGQRPQHQVRAYPEEWEMIKEFAKLVKKDVKRSKEVLEAFKA